MKQQGNTIHPGNIQHFAESAANAIQLGQRQFFTPPDLSAALCSVFRNNAATIATDLMVGSGHLLKASGRKHLCGIDVDSRVSGGASAIYQADATRYFPLAASARLTHDLLLLNPPFSLQWYLDRLAPLAASTAIGVRETWQAAINDGPTMDSTLATLLIALDSLSPCGEGMMICNADTARRLIGDPEGSKIEDRGSKMEDSSSLHPQSTIHNPPSPLLRNVWCWLDIPGAIYENQQTAFPTAVLYFSASHGRICPEGRLPLYLHAPSADPQTVERTLATAISARPFAFCGRVLSTYNAQDWEDFKPVWDAVRSEYHQLYHGAPPCYNLMLGDNGRIKTHLDPFRREAYQHNRDLLLAFQKMHGESPAALVVQQASRAALKHAMASGAWRVDPALAAAVDAAITAYEAIRAPFYMPNEVQSLGWLDEENEIVCERSHIPGFRPGQAYAIRSWIEETSWKDRKINIMGDEEKLELTGRELVVELLDDTATPHHFHVRRDKKLPPMDSKGTHHHLVQALIDNFRIPVPKDVAQTNPALYQHNLARLDLLEQLINAA